jgi:signal peptide peptidase SppA
LAIRPEMVNVLVNLAQKQMTGESVTRDDLAAAGLSVPTSAEYFVSNGVAVVPIMGVIGKGKNRYVDASVEQIQQDFAAAIDDPNVSQILLHIDSPGGWVSGSPELSDYIFAARGEKPIVAFAQGMMCSGAYFIGSAADQIFASTASVVGSIGVYTVLFDASVLLHNFGIKANLIKAGKFKAAGDITQPLSEDDRQKIQAEIDTFYDLFVSTVARNRNIAREKALSLADGSIWIGQKAVEAGLIDGLRTFDQMVLPAVKGAKKVIAVSGGAQIEDPGNSSRNITTTQEDEQMANEKITVEKLKADNKEVSDALIQEGKVLGVQEGRDQGIIEGRALGIEEGKKAGKAEAEASEKSRVSGIIGAMPPGGEKLAIEAIRDGLSVDQSKDKFLKGIAAQTPAATGPAAESEERSKLEGLAPKERAEKEWEANAELRKQFVSKEAYVGYRKAELEGRIRSLTK